MRTLDNFIPKSENDFLEYAELLSDKIRSYEVLNIFKVDRNSATFFFGC